MQKTWKAVYISEIVETDKPIIDGILKQATINNAREDLTGLLLRDRKHFLQFLEGEPKTLGGCLLRIGADRRHRRIRLLVSQSTETRLFRDWSLALAELPTQVRTLNSFARKIEGMDEMSRALAVDSLCLEAAEQQYKVSI